jgi:hypothetical protein
VKPLSLQIAAALVTIAFGIPITFFPLRWAKIFGWSIPAADISLTRYFARCLGVLALALAGLAVYASRHPTLLPPVLLTVSLLMLALAVVHLVGFLEKAQPPSETAEIFMYLGGGLYFGWLFWT